MSLRPVLVPNPHHPCTECTRITDARHAAERSGDWNRAELLRREGAHRG